MESPGSKVLHTVELLEEVLTNLDINDLFGVQRTSTTFRDVLQSSHFKRKMFMLASSPTEVSESLSKESFRMLRALAEDYSRPSPRNKTYLR